MGVFFTLLQCTGKREHFFTSSPAVILELLFQCCTSHPRLWNVYEKPCFLRSSSAVPHSEGWGGVGAAPSGARGQGRMEGLNCSRSSPGALAACGAPSFLSKLMDGGCWSCGCSIF